MRLPKLKPALPDSVGGLLQNLLRDRSPIQFFALLFHQLSHEVLPAGNAAGRSQSKKNSLSYCLYLPVIYTSCTVVITYLLNKLTSLDGNPCLPLSGLGANQDWEPPNSAIQTSDPHQCDLMRRFSTPTIRPRIIVVEKQASQRVPGFMSYLSIAKCPFSISNYPLHCRTRPQ